MIDHLARGWRVLATGLCFLLFGLGGLLMRVAIFPVMSLISRSPATRAQRAKRLIHHTFATFVGLMQWLGVMRVTITGAERLQRTGLLVLANHPSLIDVVLLMALLPRADCVVKGALAKNPFTRGPVRSAGYVFNDSGAGLVDDCIASVRSGNTLVIFPEGTRTPLAGGMHFQRGSANVAVRGGIDVTPVLIKVSPPTLTKGVPWWRVPLRRPAFELHVQPDIAIAPHLGEPGAEAMAARQFTDFLLNYFSQQVQASE